MYVGLHNLLLFNVCFYMSTNQFSISGFNLPTSVSGDLLFVSGRACLGRLGLVFVVRFWWVVKSWSPSPSLVIFHSPTFFFFFFSKVK